MPQPPSVMHPNPPILFSSIPLFKAATRSQGESIEDQFLDLISSIQPCNSRSSEGDFTYALKIARLVSSVGSYTLFFSSRYH